MKSENFVFLPVNNFTCGLSLRSAGDMKFNKENPNRLALFKELKIKPEKVYGLNQIHSKKVLVVDSNNPPSEEADGMITNDKNIVLSVTVADCLPVFFLDEVNSAFGIVHSGWKGTGIAIEALNLMKKHYNTKEETVCAVLGPCIGSCCYKVDAQRASIFEKDFGTQSIRKDKNDIYIDLKAANLKLLQETGVKNITVSDKCTCCDYRFGSFRRQGEGFTKMIALTWINPC